MSSKSKQKRGQMQRTIKHRQKKKRLKAQIAELKSKSAQST